MRKVECLLPGRGGSNTRGKMCFPPVPGCMEITREPEQADAHLAEVKGGKVS